MQIVVERALVDANRSLADAFADAADAAAGGTLKPIHIRIQQRNGRKTLTTVQGIPNDYDQKKIVRAFKKVGLTNYTI